MLVVDHVFKSYGESPVLNDVTLRLAPQETHCILGSSGSGKSTLVRAMLGLVRADRGRLQWQNQDLQALSSEQRARMIGYMPQEGGLFPHLNATDNVSIVARHLRWSEAKIQNRIEELLQIVPLQAQLLTRFPYELSGGQRQRLALMRAAFLDAELLLMDEPLGALDPMVRADLQHELRESFAKLRKTVVFVTHDLGEAAYLSQTVTLMHEGKVIQTGTMDELRDHPKSDFVTRFLSAQRLFQAGVGG